MLLQIFRASVRRDTDKWPATWRPNHAFYGQNNITNRFVGFKNMTIDTHHVIDKMKNISLFAPNFKVFGHGRGLEMVWKPNHALYAVWPK